jgi:hypothetical protein
MVPVSNPLFCGTIPLKKIQVGNLDPKKPLRIKAISVNLSMQNCILFKKIPTDGK